MYLKISGQIYPNIICYKRTTDIVYVGGSLTGIDNIIGIIGVYANNGFLLREDNVADYERQIIRDGEITLTNLPEPEPEPEPPEPEPEPDMWDELAAAIKDGVNHVE